MLNLIGGSIMLAAVLLLALWYRPKERDSLLICGIGLFMALLSLLAVDGFVSLQAAGQGLQAVVLCCCFLQLRRERQQRRARAVARRVRQKQQLHRLEQSGTETDTRICA